jgi:hydroxyacylglutathione hydrolase
MTQLEIRQIPVLNDNYVYLVHEAVTGTVAVVDPACVTPVLRECERAGWTLSVILNTHHHNDHVGANYELKWLTRCTVVGPSADRHRIPGIDRAVQDGETFNLGQLEVRVMAVPGHTSGHIAYYVPAAEALFCGDTLFSIGCGRLFEGTPAQMWASLQALRALPPTTRVYCAHEYTAGNVRFALSVDPDNEQLRNRAAAVGRARARGLPTIPSVLWEECAANPFLRADDPALQAALGMPGADPVEVFATLRARKDTF